MEQCLVHGIILMLSLFVLAGAFSKYGRTCKNNHNKMGHFQCIFNLMFMSTLSGVGIINIPIL